MGLKITPELLGALGETYYKEYCAQHGWAYVSLEQIYKNKIQNGRLEFKLGFERILIKIPNEIKSEIESLATPSNKNEESPSFVYDFLACKAYESSDPRFIDGTKPDDFRWVEVKTGKSELSENQLSTSERIKIQFVICRIIDVTEYPEDLEIYWNTIDQDLEMSDELNDS